MKTLILYDGFYFPLSSVAGAIFTGKLPEKYIPGIIWNIIPDLNQKKRFDAQMCCFVQTDNETMVVSLSAHSGRLILRNLIPSFLIANNISESNFRILEIKPPYDFYFWIGQLLLRINPKSNQGMRMVDNYIMRIYPLLVNFAKLDCYSQIADNYTKDHILCKINKPHPQKGF